MSADSPTVPDPEAQHALALARSQQNLPLAAVAGLAVAAASAAVWAAVTAATGYQIGLMAIAAGFLVGITVRATGRGIDVSFRIVASLLSLLACAAGNLLTGCILFAQAHEVGVERVLEVMDADLAWFLMEAMFSPMDLLFYGIAVWEAWRLSVIHPVPARSAA